LINDLSEITAIILLGGKGTRLASMVSEVAKPMAPIQGKPFLEYLICYLKSFSINQFIFLTGHKHDSIENYFSDGSKFKININYSREYATLGTGGAIKQAEELILSEYFLLLNGDTFFELDINKFLKSSKMDCLVNIALKHVNNAKRYGFVKKDNHGYITQFKEKPKNLESGNINTGFYLMKKIILDQIPLQETSLENDIFPQLINKMQIAGQSLEGNFIDIGIPEDYLKAQEVIPTWTKFNSNY